MLNLSKQELGGTGLLLALHLWLHVSLMLHFCEFVSCHLVGLWKDLGVGEAGCFQLTVFLHPVNF